MADPVAEHIIALRDEDWAIREDAAARLGSLKDSRAVCPLISSLRDHDRSVREAAIGALTAIGAPAVPALGECWGSALPILSCRCRKPPRQL
ncbi:MAG: HEAT repeat domain-containing protein [Nitrospira sp.]|nr:HEAT repeat domain-containing protein [Nitrospira sp.]